MVSEYTINNLKVYNAGHHINSFENICKEDKDIYLGDGAGNLLQLIIKCCIVDLSTS